MFYRSFAVRTYFVYALLLMLICIKSVSGQSSSFTYQGRLTDGGTAANGNYDLQLTLWDSLSGGTQIGSPIALSTVSVSNGVFTVSLDFGASSFPGANRFLELSARPSGTGSFTLLTPRQQITSTPYAVRSVSAANADSAATATNAAQLGGLAASQYVQTGDSRLSDARPPTAGSSNYIQNSTSPQSSTNFNVSGNGTVGGNLTANGKVLVGTTSSSFKLEVVDSSNGLRVQTNNTGGTIASFGANGVFEIDAVNVPGGRLIVKENGNVGIGSTSTGLSRLYVQNDNGPAVFAFAPNGTAIDGQSGSGIGVHGFSQGTAVEGVSNGGVGVVAASFSGNLMEGYSSSTGNFIRKFHISNDGTYTAGSDFAEAMPGRGDRDNYEPGDVLIVSSTASGTVEKSRRPNDVRLAGVYSTRPGMLGAEKNGTSRVDPDDLPVAIVGIVSTKVSTENGPVQVGDLLTTSSTPGYAMKALPMRVGRARVYRTGTILGKALEPFKEGKGVIKVLVTLR